jgi:hypothetical protein
MSPIRIIPWLIGALLLGVSPTFAETGCPQFLIATGYGDLCSPSAWMVFEHQGRRNKVLKHHSQRRDAPSRPARVKFRPSHGSSKNSKK